VTLSPLFREEVMQQERLVVLMALQVQKLQVQKQ
jgi:hypothetical protein